MELKKLINKISDLSEDLNECLDELRKKSYNDKVEGTLGDKISYTKGKMYDLSSLIEDIKELSKN